MCVWELRMSTLSLRQQRFVKELLADQARNATEAAIKAGYSAHSAKFQACSLMRNHAVQLAIQNELRDICGELHVDATLVVRGILDSIQQVEAAGIGAWQLTARLRGWELLGRYLGMFHEKVDITADQMLMDQLMRGRLRAAGLEPEEDADEQAKQVALDLEKKPN